LQPGEARLPRRLQTGWNGGRCCVAGHRVTTEANMSDRALKIAYSDDPLLLLKESPEQFEAEVMPATPCAD